MKVALILALVAVASAIPSNSKLVRPVFAKNGFTGRIVGGSNANENEFPHQISLQITDSSGKRTHLCGGAIYSETRVLTSGHCVLDQIPADMTIVAGAHDIFTSTGREQVRGVASYVQNPNFEGSVFNNDIAIIELSEPLIFNSRVQPIRIAESTFQPEGKCVNTGWGNVKGDGTVTMPGYLQKVELDVIPRETCQEMYSGINEVTNGMVCAGEGGKGACDGDSGGPLVCKDAAGRQYLAGVVSWGTTPCALSGYPTVYSNIAAYRNWIESIVNP